MRQQPKQQRSRQLVSDTIEAAVQQLSETGPEGFSTSSVAARAGVSVGSVYQYFANKDELLDAVSEHMTEQVMKLLDSMVDAQIHASPREFCEVLIGAMVDYVNERPLLIQSLLASGAERRLFLSSERIESRFTDLFRSYALQHHTEFAAINLPAAVFVSFTSTLAVALRLQLVNRPGVNRDSVVAMLVDACMGGLRGAGGYSAT